MSMSPDVSSSEPRRWLEPLICCLLAAISSLFFSQWVFRYGIITGDEGSYLFQANNFLDGTIARECPLWFRELWYDMIILRPDAGWLSRYPPGHPIWLMPGVLLGFPHLMSAMAAAFSTLIMYRLGLRLRFPRLLLPILMMLSPYVLFMSGTLLSHSSALVWVSLMFWAYVVWRQEERWLFALISGLAWSAYFLNRTYSALLLAIPFGVDSLIMLTRRWRQREEWIGCISFAGSACVGIVLYLIYNHLSTGHATTATYLFYEPSENLGFGPRRTQGMVVHHSLEVGLQVLKENLLLLDRWLYGLPSLLPLSLLLGLIGWSKRWSLLLFAAVSMIPLGYVYFWFPGVRDVGPVYYYDMIGLLLLLPAFGVSRLWDWAAKQPRIRIGVSVALLLLIASSAGRFSWLEAQRLRSHLQVQVDVRRTLQELPKNSIVFFHGFPRNEWRTIKLNPKGMNSDPLLFADSAERTQALAASFPDRKAFILRFESRDELEELNITPVSYVIPGTHNNRFTGTNEGDLRVARESEHAEGYLSWGSHRYLPAGRIEIRCRYEGIGDSVEGSYLDLARHQGREILIKEALTTDRNELRTFLDLKEPSRVELRVYYGGKGELQLREIELRVLDPKEEAP